jgi:hypothetical protein
VKAKRGIIRTGGGKLGSSYGGVRLALKEETREEAEETGRRLAAG